MTDLPQFVIVPYEKMEELLQTLKELKEGFKTTLQRGSGALGDFVSEKEAMNMLSRRTTWFWNMRKAGKLKGRKAGGQWFYRHSDLMAFIEGGSP